MAAPSDLVFAPLGGVGEIGMNLALYGLGTGGKRTWLAVDLGVAFAGDDLPGIDLIMPDISFLEKQLYRFVLIPVVRKQLKKQGEDYAWSYQRPRWGPGRIDPFNPMAFRPWSEGGLGEQDATRASDRTIGLTGTAGFNVELTVQDGLPPIMGDAPSLLRVVQNLLGGDEMVKRSRTAEIVADAAYVVLCSNSRTTTGGFLLDEDVLRKSGVTDFAKYAVSPGADLFPDLFLD